VGEFDLAIGARGALANPHSASHAAQAGAGDRPHWVVPDDRCDRPVLAERV